MVPHSSHDDLQDVEMVDIEDRDTLQAIARQTIRNREVSRSIRVKGSFEEYNQVLPFDIQGLFLIDTNFAISHLSVVKSLVDKYHSSKRLVLIPWIVIQELDGLKNASEDYGQANLATLARSANRFIYDCLQKSIVGLRGQKIGECLTPGETGDDAILDCARYWSEKQELSPVLLSNDYNLCSKILIHGMQAISFEPGLNADKILARSPTSGTQDTHEASHEAMEVDSRVRDQAHSANVVNYAVEMDTDAIIAPFHQSKARQEDPFEVLARKAGKSRFEDAAQPLEVRGRSPPTRRRGSEARSCSRMSRSSKDSSPDARMKNTGESRDLPKILQDVEQTMLEALPPLIRLHLVRELIDEDSVDFLLQEGITTLEDLTCRIVENWFIVFSKLLPQFSHDKDAFRKLSTDLTSLLSSNNPSTKQVVTTVKAWSEVWKCLATSARSQKYLVRQAAQIDEWLESVD